MPKSTYDLIRELGLTHEVLKLGVDALLQGTDDAGPHIVVEDDRVALVETRAAEMAVASHVARLADAPARVLTIPEGLWGSFKPHEAQQRAVELMANQSAMILTGGPGTGKSSLMKCALKLFQANNLKVVQVAPTGKAADKLSKATGFPASTIHRALGFDGATWLYNARKPFPCNVLVIDECSMVSADLMAPLLDAVKTGTRVIWVGDVDQLPSIQPGRVLADMIASGRVEVATLTQIFRQAGPSCPVHASECPGAGACADFDPGSRIPYVARDINRGSLPADLHAEGTDFRFIEKETEEEVLQLIVYAVTTGIPKHRGIASADIQVLAAQKSKGVGVEALNYALQHALNPTSDHNLDVSLGSNYLGRAGDKVIHTENNYELGVFNGEMGRILASDPRGLDLDRAEFADVRTAEDAVDGSDDTEMDDYFSESEEREERHAAPRTRKAKYVLVVAFDGRLLGYTAPEARDLLLGYAITIHKSQGSQFPAVIMPIDRGHAWMNTRPLIYTGLTRAESYACFIGQTKALAKAASNTRGTERRTQLRDFLSR